METATSQQQRQQHQQPIFQAPESPSRQPGGLSSTEKLKNVNQVKKHSEILSELKKQQCNQFCADCEAAYPDWASVNLGVFVCLRCSGLHRQVGTHISKVRSTTLDTWTPEQIQV
jgi:hypothetical protein